MSCPGLKRKEDIILLRVRVRPASGPERKLEAPRESRYPPDSARSPYGVPCHTRMEEEECPLFHFSFFPKKERKRSANDIVRALDGESWQ